MEPFRNILVAIDAAAPAVSALERAERLARTTGAALTIGDARSLSHGLRHLPADVSRHDLIVSSFGGAAAPDRARCSGFCVELLRKSPSPVLFVAPGSAPLHPRILGVVDASTEDAAERALNVRVVELTLLMARLEEGEPFLLQAWSPFAERVVRSHSEDEEFASYVERMRQRTAADLDALVGSFGARLSGVQGALRRGDAEDVIPEFAAGQGIDLVVIAAAPREGLARVLAGNGAERVVRKLRCSVLAIP